MLIPAPTGAFSTALAKTLRVDFCQELWEERTAIMAYDGHLPRVEAERLAWAGLQATGAVRCGLGYAMMRAETPPQDCRRPAALHAGRGRHASMGPTPCWRVCWMASRPPT